MTTHPGERLGDPADLGGVPNTVSISLGRSPLLDDVLDAVTVGVIVHDVDGHVVAINEACRGLLAGLPATVLDNAVTAVARTAGPPRSFTLTTARTDGSPRRLVATSVPHQRTRTVVTTVRDVTAGRGADEAAALRRALESTERRLQTVMNRSPIGTAVLSNHGRLLDANKVLARLLGRGRGALAGVSLAEITHPDDAAREEHLYDKLLSRSIDAYELEKRYLRPDGSLVWVRQSMAPVPDARGGPEQFVLQAQDISETRTAVARLTHQARHDGLTGLANRAYCVETIQAALAHSRSGGMPVAVLCLDIDNFRVVNDGIGPGPADAVLVAVADRIARLLEPGDTAARLGGDEFVVVRPQVSEPAEVSELAERLLSAVRDPVDLDGRVMVPAASIGIAVSDDHDVDAGTLLRDAGAALHRAKSSGRGGWDLADEALRRDARERLDLEGQLRAAVAGGQLRLHLQPIVDLADGRVVGHEALVRWQHPEHGLLPPSRFLPVAEQTGLIDDLGRWVITEATRIAAACPEIGYVAINVSPSQVRRRGLVEDIQAALASTGLAPSRLVIELTESVMLSGAQMARDQLERLYRIGVRLVVDDFGTGFSALSHLRDLPVSGIKIDRSFTQGLGHDRQCERIVEALTGLATGLDVDLVVEGVETEHQAQLLTDIGCRHAQGYLFGRPEPAAV